MPSTIANARRRSAKDALEDSCIEYITSNTYDCANTLCYVYSSIMITYLRAQSDLTFTAFMFLYPLNR